MLALPKVRCRLYSDLQSPSWTASTRMSFTSGYALVKVVYCPTSGRTSFELMIYPPCLVGRNRQDEGFIKTIRNPQLLGHLAFPSQTIQPPVFHSDEERGPAIAV